MRLSLKKLVYITGAGRGIGRSIAVRLANEGYEVRGCARSLPELEETKRLSGGKVHITQVDVQDEAAVERWLSAPMAPDTVLWGLVSAAGVYGPIGPFWENSWRDWKQAIDINLNGTLIACASFVRALRAKNSSGRIVLLSGGGATQPLPNFTSYCAAKAAVVRFGETLAQELKPFGITVNSIAPGAVNTRLTDELIEAGPEKAGRDMYEKALKQKEEGGADPEKAAGLASYLLSEESSSVTGRLLSAIWDPWRQLHQRPELLETADVFTLRRIVPEDRGLKS